MVDTPWHMPAKAQHIPGGLQAIPGQITPPQPQSQRRTGGEQRQCCWQQVRGRVLVTGSREVGRLATCLRLRRRCRSWVSRRQGRDQPLVQEPLGR